MERRQLDRSRYYAQSFGRTDARYLQDGIWFDNQGFELEVQPGGVTPPAQPSTQENPAPSPEDLRQAAGGAPRMQTTTIGKVNAPKDPPPAEDEPRAQLEALPLAKVKTVAKKAGAPQELLAAKGKSAKKPLVDWLVANVE